MPDPNDPSLVVDRRQQVADPGLHAILIGVSDYDFLPPHDEPGDEGLAALKKLGSPALSAFRFRQKLEQLDAQRRLRHPLKTVRLLVAPSAEEIGSEPALQNAAPRPTFEAIKQAMRAWRSDVAEAKAAAGLFYFGGHGIRRMLEETILLASDFLDPDDEVQLSRAFRLSNVRAGMAPTTKFPDIGLTQFYFVDACRDKPRALDSLDTTQTPKIFEPMLNVQDDRKAPTYFATYPGGLAAGEIGKETYFYQSIEWAVEHASTEQVDDGTGPVWPVNAVSLKKGIEYHNPIFAGRVELNGYIGDPQISFRPDPPTFELKVTINPEEVRPKITRAYLFEVDREKQIPLPAGADPRVVTIEAGYYRIEIEAEEAGFPLFKSRMSRLAFDCQIPWPVNMGAAVP
jgi:Caspase domain